MPTPLSVAVPARSFAGGLRRTLPLLVAAAGVALTFLAHRSLSEASDEKLRLHFEQVAVERAAYLQGALDQVLEILDATGGLFDASARVERQEFRRFVDPMLQRHPEIVAIQWTPRILHTERAAHEAALQAEGFAPEGLMEAPADGGPLAPAGERPEYLPITYTEPLAPHRRVIGLDLQSRPNLTTVRAATELGSFMASTPFRIVQEREGAPVVGLYRPVYRPGASLETFQERRDGLRGVISLLLRPARILERESQAGAPYGVDIVIFDTTDPAGGGQPLQEPSSAGDGLAAGFGSAPDRSMRLPLRIPGRQWEVEFHAPAAFRDQYYDPYPLAALLTGLLFTAFLVLYLHNGSRYTRRVTRLAQELAQTNQRLNDAQQMARFGNWELDLARQRLWWSEEIYRIFELDPREFAATYENFLKAVHPEDRALVDRAYRESVRDRVPYEIVHRLLMPDGRIKFVRERGATSYDEEGEPLRSAGTVHDITALHLAALALRESEARFRTVFEQAAGGIAFADPLGNLLMVNDSFCRLVGYSREELCRMNCTELTPPEDQPLDLDLFRAIEERRADSYRLEKRFRRRDGAVVWVDLSVAVDRNAEGAPRFIVGMVFDISARRQAEQALHLLAKVFDSSGEAILITDPAARILTVNPSFTSLTGYSPEEVVGQNPHLLASGREGPEFYAAMWRDLLEKGAWQGEIWDRRKNGEIYPKWLSINAIHDELGAVSHYIGSFVDISQIKNAEASIRFLAHHDPLTGLPNRFTLQARLTQILADARRFDRSVAVLFLDLDRFKNINDSLGHHMGDLVLVEVARRLGSAVRESDALARLGGDEFVIVLPHLARPSDVAQVAQKIVRTLSQPMAIGEHLLHTSPSIGISLFPSDGEEAETLLRNADTAMYHAKAQGRSNYQFFTPEMNQAALQRLGLENDLRLALERGEFHLHYQPQFHLKSGQLAGLEALIRWRHPEQGSISPARFIPVAEESGLILPIGEWVLRTAAEQARAWQLQGLLNAPVAINVSARQFRQKAFPAGVEAILRETGMNPELLELEITESAVMEAESGAVEILQELHRMGVLLSIDDFGTGYSSLNYLKSFPLDKLKIDQSFVRDLEHDPNDAAISLAIIGLAHNLGLHVIAEGIETEPQLQLLREHGCDIGQGYLLSRPLPVEEVEALLRKA